MSREDDTDGASQNANGFLIRFLTNTAFRSILWLLIAFGVTYFFPSQGWVWYVAFAFIGIALVFAAGVKVLSMRGAPEKSG